ncbi:hypothetical protein DAPPUDRAFT_233064 [Daphnia pulex]|uniref:Uncharacterized protein n=1 Tax=Daphnia pulex TaxID=6669 RepID=E9FT32_DAPPU|nr:hypothetical protein DAPPUDRAFT_233064 [Daphnia pulex]|eukprot:EFX89299.1 hypothetical protein DAPPUDRAFT_233064 [Daphnia pulex]
MAYPILLPPRGGSSLPLVLYIQHGRIFKARVSGERKVGDMAPGDDCELHCDEQHIHSSSAAKNDERTQLAEYRPYYQQQPRDVITSNGSQSARSTINDRVCSPDRPTTNRQKDVGTTPLPSCP